MLEAGVHFGHNAPLEPKDRRDIFVAGGIYLIDSQDTEPSRRRTSSRANIAESGGTILSWGRRSGQTRSPRRNARRYAVVNTDGSAAATNGDHLGRIATP